MINLHRGTLLLVTFQTRMKNSWVHVFQAICCVSQNFFFLFKQVFWLCFCFCLFVCLFFSISTLTDIFFHSINNRATEAFPDNFNLHRVIRLLFAVVAMAPFDVFEKLSNQRRQTNKHTQENIEENKIIAQHNLCWY